MTLVCRDFHLQGPARGDSSAGMLRQRARRATMDHYPFGSRLPPTPDRLVVLRRRSIPTLRVPQTPAAEGSGCG
jgi:hypothetical protein